MKEKINLLICLFAQNSIDLVYGGSKRGIMGFISQIFLNEGREVTGIIPYKKIKNEKVSTSSIKIIYTNNLSDRKNLMIKMSDFFLILPGGLGTLDEAFEIITSNRMRFTNKKVAIFNCLGFYDDLIKQIFKMIEFNLLSDDIWNEIIIEEDECLLFEKLVK